MNSLIQFKKIRTANKLMLALLIAAVVVLALGAGVAYGINGALGLTFAPTVAAAENPAAAPVRPLGRRVNVSVTSKPRACARIAPARSPLRSCVRTCTSPSRQTRRAASTQRETADR